MNHVKVKLIRLKFSHHYSWVHLSLPILLVLFYWLLLSYKELSICIGEGNGNRLQYSCLENPMDGGAWKAVVHGVAEGQTWLSDLTFTFHFHALEKEMATHSSVLAWRIPGLGSLVGCCLWGHTRVGHDWSDLAAVAVHMHVIFPWHAYGCTAMFNTLL